MVSSSDSVEQQTMYSVMDKFAIIHSTEEIPVKKLDHISEFKCTTYPEKEVDLLKTGTKQGLTVSRVCVHVTSVVRK